MAILKNTTINDNEFLRLPSGTTAQRPPSPSTGMIRFNTSINLYEIYSGTSWIPVDFRQIQATGGTQNTYTLDGITYKIHAFLSSGTFTVTAAGEIDLLVAGGGGGGGYLWGCGGGGGGLIFRPNLSINQGSYSIVVGSGGAMTTTVGAQGASGQPSSAFGFVALGGGGGGNGDNGNPGINGGSGGGGRTRVVSEAPTGQGLQPFQASFGYGNNGFQTTAAQGIGAGGAGAAGSGTFGGDGKFNVVIGAVTYNFREIFNNLYGHNVTGERWFAGGGHGAAGMPSFPQAGSRGSGSDVLATNQTIAAIANTGGGGSGNNATGTTNGNGGSGIVLLRYRIGI